MTAVAHALPMSLTEPMHFSQPLDYTDARQAMRECAEARRQARQWKQAGMQQAAEAERTYRRARAQAWLLAPEGTAKLREDWVNDHTAQARFERDVADRLVKAADERIAEVDAERASVHRLVEFSMKMWSPEDRP